MSDDEHEEGEGPSEAELALQRRRQGGGTKSKGLTDTDRELLATNKEDRQRMDEEIKELRQRTEKRKIERAEEEKRLASERAAEEERRKAAEDEKKKKKEEDERKRKEERAKKMAEFDKFKNPTGPNFVISKRAGGGAGGEAEGEGKEGKKSKEQLEAEKKAILKQRIVPLNIDGMDQSGLTEKAKELHKIIFRLEGEKYDLEKRFKTQQIDMQELAERARQANKVGKEGLKRAQLSEGESDVMQERFAGTPAKVEMFSKYERQKDKRNYKDRKTIYTGPCYVKPPDRIKPSKSIKWNEAGMPTYEEMPEGEAPPPAAAEAGGEE